MEMSATRRSILSLSDLPDNVIEDILCRLPIEEAGRSSVLSRSWRWRWRSIPNLRISGLSASRIYHLILLHSGSIRFFKAEEWCECSLEDNEWHGIDLKLWLSTLSLLSASTLRTLCLKVCDLECEIDDIACCLPNLTHLHFTGSLIVSPQFPGFSSLKCLYLYTYHRTDRFSDIISSCPLLETLQVTLQGTCDEEITSLDIVAPNLRWLKLSEVEINDFAVTCTPALETVSIHICEYDETEDDEEEADENSDGGIRNDSLMRIFGGMASIRKLELEDGFLWFLSSCHVPERIPISFRNLKVVSLNADFCYEKTVLGALCLLRSVPVLQILEITGCNYLKSSGKELDADHGFWEAQEHLFNNLETVTMTNIACQKNEMGFIKFLLARVEFLKEIVISFHHRVKNKESIMAELLGFPRISRQARILLSRYPVSKKDKDDVHCC